MGAFYGSIQVRSDDRQSILDAVEKFTRRRKTAIFVGPVLRGWCGLYPSDNGQDERVSALLAKQIAGDLIHLIVHDDDVFSYSYYHDGKVVDRFSSRPDGLGPVSSQKRSRLKGQPDQLAHLLGDAERFADLRRLLSSGSSDTGLASRLLERFAELLDIPNAAEAYEYLNEMRGEGVEGWDKFTHVPDLAAERGRQLAAAAEQARAKQQLSDKGVLRHIECRPGTNKEFPCSLLFCPEKSDGFLVYWSDIPTKDAQPLEHYVPGRTPISIPTAIRLKPPVTMLSRSPSGFYLAVGHGYPTWKTAVWEVATGSLVRELEMGAVWAGFAPAENLLVTLNHNGCQLTRIDNGERVAEISLPRAQVATIHPDGTLIVGSHTGPLYLIDLPSGNVHKTLRVGADAAAMMVSDDGRWLAVGTTRGVGVYDWAAVINSTDFLTPIAKFDSIRTPYGGETKPVWGVAWHMAGPGLFFGGLDARIEYLDLNTGTHRVLCELPGRVDFNNLICRGEAIPFGGPAIMSMCRTADGSSLACWVKSDVLSRADACKPPELMIWDCASLLLQTS